MVLFILRKQGLATMTIWPFLTTKCCLTKCRPFSNIASSQEPSTSPFLITPQNVIIGGKTFDSDDWTNITPKILSALDRKLHLLPDHPLGLIKSRIVDFIYSKYRNHRGNPLFSVHDNLSPGQAMDFCFTLGQIILIMNGPPRLLICHQRAVHKRKIS